jgi:hypothetical protein
MVIIIAGTTFSTTQLGMIKVNSVAGVVNKGVSRQKGSFQTEKQVTDLTFQDSFTLYKNPTTPNFLWGGILLAKMIYSVQQGDTMNDPLVLSPEVQKMIDEVKQSYIFSPEEPEDQEVYNTPEPISPDVLAHLDYLNNLDPEIFKAIDAAGHYCSYDVNPSSLYRATVDDETNTLVYREVLFQPSYFFGDRWSEEGIDRFFSEFIKETPEWKPLDEDKELFDLLGGGTKYAKAQDGYYQTTYYVIDMWDGKITWRDHVAELAEQKVHEIMEQVEYLKDNPEDYKEWLESRVQFIKDEMIWAMTEGYKETKNAKV